MTLSEFRDIVMGQFAAFGDWWELSRVDLPHDYPEEMGEGDWWEQFLAWVSVQEGGGDD